METGENRKLLQCDNFLCPFIGVYIIIYNFIKYK